MLVGLEGDGDGGADFFKGSASLAETGADVSGYERDGDGGGDSSTGI